jgi:hypothetical protein
MPREHLPTGVPRVGSSLELGQAAGRGTAVGMETTVIPPPPEDLSSRVKQKPPMPIETRWKARATGQAGKPTWWALQFEPSSSSYG